LDAKEYVAAKEVPIEGTGHAHCVSAIRRCRQKTLARFVEDLGRIWPRVQNVLTD
jgi:hypothetical protein